MASIKGFSLKSIKTFMGRDGYGCQGNIYYKGKKVGWYNDAGDGGMADINFDGTFEHRKAMEKVLTDTMYEYYKEHPLTGEYADLPVDNELFMAELVKLIDFEKFYKKGIAKGYKFMAVYTHPKTHFETMVTAVDEAGISKHLAEVGCDAEYRFSDLSDFIIE